MDRPNAIGILCKLPVAGQVKTRLIPRLGEAGACRFAAALLADALTQALRVADDCRAGLYLFFAPADAEAAMRACVPPSFHLECQPEADLGERMRAACASMFARGHARVLLYGTDCPTRPDSDIAQAFNALGQADVALSPAPDGGYGLIGLALPCDELFAPMAWSTSIVAAETRRRAGQAGRVVAELPPCADVDTPDDLDHLIAGLRGGGEGEAPQQTRRALRTLGLLLPPEPLA